MKFYEYGEKNEQVIVMLPGSFCPADALEYLYKDLADEYHVILPEYIKMLKKICMVHAVS